MRGKTTGLKAKPVDAGERDLAARGGIHQFTVKGFEETYLITCPARPGGLLCNRSRSFCCRSMRGFFQNGSSSRRTSSQDQCSQNQERQYSPRLSTCYAGTSHMTLPFNTISISYRSNRGFQVPGRPFRQSQVYTVLSLAYLENALLAQG